ncbi:uncharacterized protein LOC111828599 [Capsella rubella]|uniref:uncharacterized protein LOC111828599 n=1 Tax=Capsella rubella TaxID=81985 RepID=UPI000CD5572F|nr:uncharacterized protein LOC111828599 [Capsella rubella]
MNGEYREAIEAGRGRPPRLQRQYMAMAFSMSLAGIFTSAVLCVEFLMERWIMCAIFSAWNIVYLGMLIRIWWKDEAPVQTYQLGAEGRFHIFLAVMIYMFCISYSFQDLATRGPWVLFCGAHPIGAMGLIVCLSWPIEDFKPNHVYTMITGIVYGFVGGIGRPLAGFCVILGFFLIILFMEIRASVREEESATVLLINNNEVI